MVDFGELRVRLGLDPSSLKAGLAQAKTDLTTWRDETNANTASTAKWGAAIAATVAPVMVLGTAVYSAQQKFGAMANEIDDMSMTTGLSTEKIQQLQYAATLSGDSFSTVAMGINYLTLSMQKATDATSEQGKAFAALGVSTAGKSPDQVFEDTATALMGMQDTTKRNEIAMALYGRSWKEMLPFMEDYIKNKEKIQKTPTFSKQELQDLKDAKTAWDDLGNSVTIYSGKALVAVQSQFSSKNLDSILTLDAAYRKLFTGDVKGYIDIAAGYHDKLAKEEAAKLTAQAASGAPSTVQGTNLPEPEDAADLIDGMTDAMKGYKDAIDDVSDAQSKLNDINKDYTRSLQTLDPTDVQGFIDLRQRHKWDIEDQSANINTAKTGAVMAAGEVARAGMATAGIIINGPITVNGDKSFEKEIQNQRIRAGVR